jgi:hypothetical protein
VTVTVELGLLAGTVVIAAISGEPFAPAPPDLIVVIAAAALGLQNAAAANSPCRTPPRPSPPRR